MDPAQPYQHFDHNDMLQFGPRYKGKGNFQTDELVAQIFHRTTGGGRSAVLRRPVVEQLCDWLNDWLNQGWDGTPRTCQDRFKERGCQWECDQQPGHLTRHEGPATGWRTEGGRPGRNYWDNDGSRCAAVPLQQALEPGDG